jgi:ABC-type branched-subunit amino acid transport system substrate-binding protein
MHKFVANSIGLVAFCFLTVASAQNVRIAVIEPQSGPVANVGVPSSTTKNYLADAFNAKGGLPGGAMFEVLTFDNKASPQESLVILKDVIDKENLMFSRTSAKPLKTAFVVPASPVYSNWTESRPMTAFRQRNIWQLITSA